MSKDGSVAPKERVNVTFKPVSGDAAEDLELPLKMMVLGDFTQQEDDRKLEDRKPFNVDKSNFNDVIEKQNLNISFGVKNQLQDDGEGNEEIAVDLSFKHINDFDPSSIVELSLPFLEDADIDYVTDKMGSQLTLKAPNAKMRKVADDAPLFERVEYAIQTQVNPQLAGHGGHVSLMEINDEGVAIVQFGGGCNGCSMVDVTLKEGIEKELLVQFEGELTAVKDLTEHDRGEHSYY